MGSAGRPRPAVGQPAAGAGRERAAVLELSLPPEPGLQAARRSRKAAVMRQRGRACACLCSAPVAQNVALDRAPSSRVRAQNLCPLFSLDSLSVSSLSPLLRPETSPPLRRPLSAPRLGGGTGRGETALWVVSAGSGCPPPPSAVLGLLWRRRRHSDVGDSGILMLAPSPRRPPSAR